jgi:thioredoxin reductase (NADPH)
LGEPIVLVVTDRDSVGAVLVGDLRRRFGADYRVIEVGSGEAALAAVADASARSQEVALVIADQTMTGVPAIEILVRVRELTPTAKRVLLIDRGDWSPTHPVVSAMALGQVDYHLYNPWHPLERILYPAVSDFLSAWNKSQDAPVVPARIVGARSSPLSPTAGHPDTRQCSLLVLLRGFDRRQAVAGRGRCRFRLPSRFGGCWA